MYSMPVIVAPAAAVAHRVLPDQGAAAARSPGSAAAKASATLGRARLAGETDSVLAHLIPTPSAASAVRRGDAAAAAG